MPFSSLKRNEIIKEIKDSNLDLLVIGGGITGAGILLDAVSRGLRSALIEMQDFAAGTSSRSTKLVHGGLRYLKQFEVSLVAEVGKERAIVYENAPHVTTPCWMLLPIVEGGTFGQLSTSFGLSVYDFLAGVKKTERKKMLSKGEALKKEPLLRRDGLKGAGYYVEYRTDDARLTLEVIKEAVQRGGNAINYTRAEDLIYQDGQLRGILARDLVADETLQIFAKEIVNATGPWVDELRDKDGSKKGKYLHLTKGVHVVIDQSRFPLHNAVYFDVPDGRMVFAIPRQGKTYIGTTDTNFQSNLQHPRATKQDIDYLLSATNSMFEGLNLTNADVESFWAGVRPLIHEEGKSPSEISRRDEIFQSPSGLITIAGGKLTGYRKMAKKVVDLVTYKLTQSSSAENHGSSHYPNCFTDRIHLSGGDVGGSSNWNSFIKQYVEKGVQLGLDSRVAERLVQRYGSNIAKVYDIMVEHATDAESFGLPKSIYASVLYAINFELCQTAVDFFLRRTDSMLFDIQFVYKWKDKVIDLIAQVLNYDEKELLEQSALLDKAIEEVTEAV